MADEHALAHAVANLMTNALHYTHRGAVTISTEQRLEDGDTWETLTVADTGLGIAEAEQPHLFTRFFRGAAGRATRVPGTGLGLAICRETIARHGGRITLESEGVPGKGACFTVFLPAATSTSRPPGSPARSGIAWARPVGFGPRTPHEGQIRDGRAVSAQSQGCVRIRRRTSRSGPCPP